MLDLYDENKDVLTHNTVMFYKILGELFPVFNYTLIEEHRAAGNPRIKYHNFGKCVTLYVTSFSDPHKFSFGTRITWIMSLPSRRMFSKIINVDKPSSIFPVPPEVYDAVMRSSFYYQTNQ